MAAIAPVDYGTDVSGEPDLDPLFTPLSGRAVLIQAIARRFETPSGSLFYDPDYGLDLRSCVGEGYDASGVLQLQTDIVAECLKDERVLSARARVRLLASTGAMTVTLQIQDGAGPFQFVLNVSALTVALVNSQVSTG